MAEMGEYKQDSDREKIYAEYAENEGSPEITATEEEPPKILEPEPEVEPELKVEEEKKVPLQALHEEREKRKIARQELTEVKKTLAEQQELNRQMLQDIKKLMAQPTEDDGSDSDLITRREMNAALEENKGLKRRLDQLEGRTAQEMTKRSQEQLTKQVSKAAQKAETEGCPGLDRCIPQITEELARMVQEDRDNVIYDNPDGWIKIYKERVFPGLKELFVKKDKETVMKSKEELKKTAGLTGSPGSAGTPEKADESEWTVNDYLKMRREKRL